VSGVVVDSLQQSVERAEAPLDVADRVRGHGRNATTNRQENAGVEERARPPQARNRASQ
jgi:hypothetical protein